MSCRTYDTLIGVLTQDIRRTEEQKTRNLHDHMPYYCEPCSNQCSSASRYCVRNPFCKLPKHITQSSEDYVHKKLHHAEVRAELVRFTRPEVVYVDQDDLRSQTLTTDNMLVAFHTNIHWAEQKHDETINRMLHVRRREDDDSSVATHCLQSLRVADTHVAYC